MARNRSDVWRRLGTVGKYAAWAVLIFLTALAAYIMISNMNGRAASVFGTSIVRVISGSMEPSIHNGDYIIIKKTDSSELEKGDIICFYSRESDIYGKLNTHRITERLDDGSFITKGDANNTEDSEAVKAEDILGIYSGKARLLRWLSTFASLKKLLLAAVTVIMSATAVYEVKTLAGAAAEYRADKKLRQAIDREKQKLYDRDSQDKAKSEDKKEGRDL